MSTEPRTTNATPRPWYAQDPWDGEEGHPIEIYATDEVVLVASVNTHEVSAEQALADAALIVRAVNAHDTLVAAAQAALDVIHDARQRMEAFGITSAESDKYAIQAITQLRAALRLATPVRNEFS